MRLHTTLLICLASLGCLVSASDAHIRREDVTTTSIPDTHATTHINTHSGLATSVPTGTTGLPATSTSMVDISTDIVSGAAPTSASSLNSTNGRFFFAVMRFKMKSISNFEDRYIRWHWPSPSANNHPGDSHCWRRIDHNGHSLQLDWDQESMVCATFNGISDIIFTSFRTHVFLSTAFLTSLSITVSFYILVRPSPS